MSSRLKVGQRVQVLGKDVQGVVAFYGATSFASGKWIGLVLDEPKGKNNGTVQGHAYFQCEDNYGMFVRMSQVAPLDESGRPMQLEASPDAGKVPRARHSTPNVKPKPTTVRRKTSPHKGVPSLSASSSRISLASSQQSLAGSRQSLTGSRHSLSSSRTQLASPVIERSTTEIELPSQIPKRASFIETGFVETLKPQFTPGQAISATPPSVPPSTAIEEKVSILQLQQEIENKCAQIKDLEEKLETIKMKWRDDREKLKDYDKQKIQLEQLVEFKNKIMESQALLQRDLQKARHEAQEAIEARETHAEEMADLADTIEMATLDKEMAEEKSESLQLELDACRDKLEELTLDYEILKNELQGRGNSIVEGGEGLSVYEIKQLKMQNERLRETLIKMRDLSAQNRHEYQKALKDIDQKDSEITELGKTKEKLSTRIEEMERQIANLHEQVDDALGAEEMVTLLTEQKLTLEDEVAKLRQEVAELEALREMDEELAETDKELQADLREELDLAQGTIREARRERDAAFETIVDREQTIGKFRELVQRLQEQSQDLHQRLEAETSQPVSNLPEIVDFTKMFIETKAHTKAIDLELHQIDVQQLRTHIKYLTGYMPDTFTNRGGDHDAILVLLLVPRLIHKSDILVGQMASKYPVVTDVTRASVLKEHAVEQFAFRCRFSYCVYVFQAILRQFLHGLNTCKPDILLKVGANYSEMVVQEKIVDGYVELMKRNQLDENIPTEGIEKCVNYFINVYPILLGVECEQNQCHLLSDYVKALNNACMGISNDALVIRNLIETVTVSDMGLLVEFILTSVEQLQQQLKQIKRYIPTDSAVTNLGLGRDVTDGLLGTSCHAHVSRVLKTLSDIARLSAQTILKTGELERGLSPDRMKDLAIDVSDRIYEQDDLGPVQSVKGSLGQVLTAVSQVLRFLQENEYNICVMNKTGEKPIPPVQLRSEMVKKELEEPKTLISKLQNKEADIKELRKLLEKKQEQLSEMTIRKELAEKKLGNVNKDYELKIEKLQRKLEETHNILKKKEKEFEETLDHLQSDIDSLENEKGEMKEKLKSFNKKNIMDSMIKSGSASQLSSLQSSLGPTFPAVVKDSPLLLHEIDSLRRQYLEERDRRIALQADHMLRQLASLSPLPKFDQEPEPVLDKLVLEGSRLRQDILMRLATPKFPPLYLAKPGQSGRMIERQRLEERDAMLAFKRRAEAFQARVLAEILKRRPGGRIETDLTMFPTTEMSRSLRESGPINIGSITIPGSGDSSQIVDLEVSVKNLQNLLQKLTC